MAVTWKANRSSIQGERRYRDLAISPDGLHIYVSTDDHGPTMGDRGQTAGVLANPGAILEFTYGAK